VGVLTSYGLTGATAAYGAAQSYATATAVEVLQAQIAVLQGQITALIGEQTVDEFQETDEKAMSEARQSALSLSDYAGGNYISSISSVFGNLASKLKY